MFSEVVLAILNPSIRSLGPIYLSQLQGAVMGAPLPLGESLLIAWPQIVGLVAGLDPAVRDRLYRVPAAGSARVSGHSARPAVRGASALALPLTKRAYLFGGPCPGAGGACVPGAGMLGSLDPAPAVPPRSSRSAHIVARRRIYARSTRRSARVELVTLVAVDRLLLAVDRLLRRTRSARTTELARRRR